MKKLIAIMLSLVMILGLAACTGAPKTENPDKNRQSQTSDPAGDQDGKTDDTDKRDNKEKEDCFTMGTSADYPPYEFIIINDKGEQEFVGIDISLAQALAEDMAQS